MTNKIQKTREIIEKRYEYWREKELNSHSIGSEIRMSECQHLLLMLNSLQEEPVSDDLEKEIDNYVMNNFFGSETMGFFSNETKKELNDRDVVKIARHFAKWQKEQMMANTIDGYVIEDIEEGNGDFLLSCEYLPKNMGLVDQQKVKVIVIKDD